MAYDSDPAGLGVGKHYGVRQVGDVAGVIGGVNGVETAVFQLKAGDIAFLESQSVIVPPYSMVREVVVEVSEAFAASSTIDMDLGGVSILTAAADLTVVGVSSETLTATAGDLVTDADYADMTADVNSSGAASTVGEAKVTVRFLRT